MNRPLPLPALAAALGFVLFSAWLPAPALAASAAQLDRDARAALSKLYAKTPKAKELAKQAVGVLVFPNIIKAGLLVGGQYGDGVMYKDGKVAGYYNTTGASYGMQAGAQSYGYAMFFLSDETLAYLGKSEGFEVGVGPSVVVADDSFAKSTTTTTAKDKVYAFIFDQKGAMAALGIQGNKITKIKK